MSNVREHSGNVMALRHTALLSLAILVACGGSTSEQHQEAVDQANQKEAEARAAGVASPCANVLQCGVLVLLNPSVTCPSFTYKPYSLISASAAAASAAAQQEVVLAALAISLAPPAEVTCIPFIALPPVLTCVANVCGP
jgi:hypothetical protein